MRTAPHPPFGHLLPASGEKGNQPTPRCPSPRLRGEGGRRPGEGLGLFLLLILLLATLPLSAQSTLILEGSSNVTSWKCESSTVDVSEAGLRIPVKTIRCGNRQMERDLYRALHAESYPSIDFHFVNMERGAERATIRGNLSLAGMTRPIEIDASVQPLAHDRVRMQVRLPLRMTDFRITPPTALFGMIRAKNDLVVTFDLVMEGPCATAALVHNTHSRSTGPSF